MTHKAEEAERMRVCESGRVAVVTGGTGAIGEAIVRALRVGGHRAVVLGRRGGDIRADLTSESAVKHAAAEVLDRHGRVDALVHAAAVIDPMALGDLDAERWRRVMAVNVEAALWLGHRAVGRGTGPVHRHGRPRLTGAGVLILSGFDRFAQRLPRTADHVQDILRRQGRYAALFGNRLLTILS